MRLVFDAALLGPADPSDLIVLADPGAEIAPPVLVPAIEDNGMPGPDRDPSQQPEWIPPDGILPDGVPPDGVPPDDGNQATNEDCEPVDAESEQDCPAANDSGFLDPPTEDFEGDVDLTDVQPTGQLRPGVILLPAGLSDRPIKTSIRSDDLNRDQPALLPTSGRATAVGAARSDDALRYWSRRPATPLSWSLRSDATRDNGPALSMIAGEPQSAASSVVSLAPNEFDGNDEFAPFDRSVPGFAQAIDAEESIAAVEGQVRDEDMESISSEPSDPSAHDSVFAAIATETIWAAGLLEEWPLPREAAWVIVGAVTVSEFVRTRRDTRATSATDLEVRTAR
jgi:hypothetical protein